MQFSHLCSHLVHNFLHFFLMLTFAEEFVRQRWSGAEHVLYQQLWDSSQGVCLFCLGASFQTESWPYCVEGFDSSPSREANCSQTTPQVPAIVISSLKKSQTQAPGRRWVCHVVFAERQAALDPLISVPILVSLGHKYVASFSESMCLTLFWNLSISLHFLLSLWADGRCCEYRQIFWLELSSEMMIHFRDGKAWERES